MAVSLQSIEIPLRESAVPARSTRDVTSVERLNPAKTEGWDRFVASRSTASIFHSTAWASVLESTYGYQPVYFATRAAGEIRSCLPVMEVDSALTGRRGIGLPFTDHCEPLADVATFPDLFAAAVEYGRARKWRYLEIRGGRKFLPTATAAVTFHSHSIALGGNETELLARFESSVRRAIRKAEKNGLSLECSQSPGAMREFYSLQCKTRRRHGLPPQPAQFFLNIQDRLLSQNHGMIVLARLAGQPVAASVYFHFGEEAIYKFGASDDKFQSLRGNNLVMWEAMKHLAARGCKRLQLGRTSALNDGLRNFKLSWGAAEQTLEYFRYDLRKDNFVAGQDEAFGWYNRVFRHLPLSLARLIGAALYRHIA